MSGQLIFFRKNKADYEKTGVVTTASQGDTTSHYVLDRSNDTAWGSGASVDANNTTFILDFGQAVTLDSILLLKHNFASFKIEAWSVSGGVWQTAVPTISGITASASYLTSADFFPIYYGSGIITTTKLRLTIYGTQTPNSAKYLYQFIATTRIGQLAGWPIIKKPLFSRNATSQRMASNRYSVLPNLEAYTTSLTVSNWSSDADLTIVEALYASTEGFLFWPCGGAQSQFSSVRKGYRFEDIYLVRAVNDHNPEWARGMYHSGMQIQIDLAEVTT